MNLMEKYESVATSIKDRMFFSSFTKVEVWFQILAGSSSAGLREMSNTKIEIAQKADC